MSTMTRRTFVAGAMAAGALSMTKVSAAPAKKLSGTDRVTLGKTGITTSRLGIGTGTNGGNEQLGLGQEAFTRLIRHGYERGIRYIDTADNYRTHIFTRFAIQDLPREELFIQSKTPATHPEVAKADIARYLKELKTPYIDSLLLHCMRKGGWPVDMRPVIDVLLEAKEQGKVRAIGVSCHGWDPLADATQCDWVDIHLVRINPFQAWMDETPEKVAGQMKQMKAANRGIIGMKIFGNGDFKEADKRFASLKYALSLDCVDAFTIGMNSPEQLDANLKMIEEASA